MSTLIVAVAVSGLLGLPAGQAAVPDDAAALRTASDEARAKRMAEDRARYEAFANQVDAFGHIDEFAAKLRELLAGKKGRFIPISDGVLTDIACEYWLAWNVPPSGSTIPPALDTKAEGHPFRAIVDFNRQLRDHGVDLLLVTFPTRAQLYPELFMPLPTMEGFSGICPATPRFAVALIDAGVEVLYLGPEFLATRYGEGGDQNDQLFLKFNQHWAPRCAEMAAKLITDRVARFPWFKPGAAKEGVDWVVNERAYEPKIVWGDGPKDAKEERRPVNMVTRPDLTVVGAVRPSSPITLLAGSFGVFHEIGYCDFTSQLYRFTGHTIDRIDPKGGVEDTCRQLLAARTPREWSKKKLVIWMVPEQVFRLGKMWRPIPIFPK